MNKIFAKKNHCTTFPDTPCDEFNTSLFYGRQICLFCVSEFTQEPYRRSRDHNLKLT